jgi:hypothetical protein
MVRYAQHERIYEARKNRLRNKEKCSKIFVMRRLARASLKTSGEPLQHRWRLSKELKFCIFLQLKKKSFVLRL